MSNEEIYIRHHKERKKEGKALLKNERGAFLRHAIGTGKKVLDIGCRDGALTREYSTGNKVLGVDIDPGALEEAKRNLSIDTFKMDLCGEWNLPEKNFDAVVAGEVLEHLYYPKYIIKEVCRFLSDDGIFVGSVPNAFSLANRIRLFFGMKEKTPLSDPTHINHFKYSELKSILKEGFKEVSIIPLGKFTFLDKIFPGYFSYMLLFKASKPRR